MNVALLSITLMALLCKGETLPGMFLLKKFFLFKCLAPNVCLRSSVDSGAKLVSKRHSFESHQSLVFFRGFSAIA